VTQTKQDNNTNTKKQKNPKTSCRQWRRRPKTLDDSACKTHAVTRTTQTKIRRRRTGCHSARLEKAECDPHAHLGAENSQVCGRHVPITDDRQDRSLRLQGQRTTGNAAGGACQSEVGGEVQIWLPKSKKKSEKAGHSPIEDILR